jgi:hypothetical protein
LRLRFAAKLLQQENQTGRQHAWICLLNSRVYSWCLATGNSRGSKVGVDCYRACISDDITTRWFIAAAVFPGCYTTTYLLNLHHTGREPIEITDLGDSFCELVTASLLVVTNGAF